MMKKYVSEELPPSNYKNYKKHKKIFLEQKSRKHSHLNTRINLFFSNEWKNKSVVDINKTNLGSFLFYLLGEVGRKSMHVTGEHIAKTSPSGGARHPTEGYLEVIDVKGMQSGLYHYNVAEHALELLTDKPLSLKKQSKIFGYSHPKNLKVNFLIYFSSIFERSMYRYRESRSYRVLQIDLGHILQTSYFLCKSNGWYNFRTYAPSEKTFEKRIGLKDYNESLMALIAVSGKANS